MLERVAHAVMPVAVIIAALVLAVTRRIDGTTAVAMIGSAGGAGAALVAALPVRAATPPK